MPNILESRPARRLICCLGAVIAGLSVLIATVPTAHATTGSGWTILASPNGGAPQSDLLMGTACTSSWNCWAAGGQFSSGLGNNSQPHALLDRWNGTSWSAGPDVSPPGTKASLLWGVECTTAVDCWAVGGQAMTNHKGPVTLAEHWNGTAWSVVATPAVSGYLFSVACSTGSDCWAVGSALDNQQNATAGIIYHWNGSSWSQVSPASSGQRYDEFNSVTCAGGSDCWAVGYAGPNQVQYGFLPGVLPNVVDSTALVEHWNGSAWSVVPSPPAPTPLGRFLTSVACTASGNCWAVGSTMDAKGNPSTTLAEHWSGSSWTAVPSPDPSTPANILTTVTCLGNSDCWASGATGAASGQNGGTPSPFIENWNGSHWSVDPSPNVVSFGYLDGLACVQGTGCFATGFAATNLSNNTTLQTLIEQLRVAPAQNQGLWMSGTDGGVFNLGNAGFYGSAGGLDLRQPVVGMAATPDGGGYWLVASDGGVFSFGDAHFHGSTGALTLNRPVVGMAATPDGGGYWLVASDGGVFSFGDAHFHGSTGALTLNRPVVGMAATPDGGGYWLVASDGGVFSFGDTPFYGSTGALSLSEPIVGMAAAPDGGGYWLVASDGGVFSFGDAGYYGSVPGQGITDHVPVSSLVATPTGRGYWIVGQDGALYSYGDASFLGSLVGVGLGAPIDGSAGTT